MSPRVYVLHHYGLSLIYWNVLQVHLANIFGEWSKQDIICVLFNTLQSPTRDPSQCENRYKYIVWNPQQVVY